MQRKEVKKMSGFFRIGKAFSGKGHVTSGGYYRLKYSRPKDPARKANQGAAYIIDRRSGRVYQWANQGKHRHWK
jgi:hypothetical protein